MESTSKYDLVVGDQRLERRAERGARTKSGMVTLIILGALLLAALFTFIPKQDPPYPESQDAVGVLLGNVDDAYGTEYGPVKAGDPGSSGPTDPTPTPPADQSPPIETGDDPDAAAINQPDKTPPVKTKQPINPEPKPQTQTTVKSQPKAKINNSLLDDESGNGDGGANGLGGDLNHSGDPNGKGNGQKGKPNGNGYKPGNGQGHNAGDGRYRKLTNSPKYSIAYDQPGVVIVSVSIDKNGNVVDATPGGVGTTITDNHVFLQAKEAAMKYKFDPNPNAAYREYTTITIKISVR